MTRRFPRICWLYTLVLLTGVLGSCAFTKNKVDFGKVRQGELLHRAAELDVDQFFQIWMRNRFPTKVDVNCHELYQDSAYTYFGKNKLTVLDIKPYLYKVHTDSLSLRFGKYRVIDGDRVRKEFWDKGIPVEDKKLRQDSTCHSGSSKPIYTYKLQGDHIFISLDWKVTCNGKKVLDKTYTGNYNMTTLTVSATE